MSNKKILLCSSKGRKQGFLNDISDGLRKFGDFEREYLAIGPKILERLDDFSIVICSFWYIDAIGRKIWESFRERKIPIVFLSDGCFFYGYKHSKIKTQRPKYPFLVFMNGPQSAPWGDKHYRNDLPNDRVKLFKPEIDLKPWRKKGNHIILAHQAGGTHDGGSKQEVYDILIKKCIETGRPIIFRLHPNSNLHKNKKFMDKIKGIPNCKISRPRNRKVDKDFINAHCLVTYGGKVAAKAIIEGIPAITYDRTVAEMVAERDIDNIENPRMPKRESWINWLSYCHWTIEEMHNGTMWKFFIKNGYLKI